MSDPIVFIIHNQVKQGMLDDFTNHYQARKLAVAEANKPGTLVQLTYVNDDSKGVTVIRVFPSADALDKQLQGADERSKVTYQFIEPTSVEIYGIPSQFALEMIKKVAGPGIDVNIFPHFMGGYIRPGSG